MDGSENASSARRPLRADAQRNRRRILDAARHVFAERGLDVPLDDIADYAGVGIATLYRRFPTRGDLVMAAFEARLEEYAQAAEEALESPDRWAAFCGYVERICAMQAADKGFTDVVTMTLTTSERAEQLHARGRRAAEELVRLTQEAGELREDFVPEDLTLLLMANAGVIHITREAAPHAWRRLMAYMLEAFRACHAGPLPAAPTPAQVRRAMVGSASQRMCATRSKD